MGYGARIAVVCVILMLFPRLVSSEHLPSEIREVTAAELKHLEQKSCLVVVTEKRSSKNIMIADGNGVFLRDSKGQVYAFTCQHVIEKEKRGDIRVIRTRTDGSASVTKFDSFMAKLDKLEDEVDLCRMKLVDIDDVAASLIQTFDLCDLDLIPTEVTLPNIILLRGVWIGDRRNPIDGSIIGDSLVEVHSRVLLVKPDTLPQYVFKSKMDDYEFDAIGMMLVDSPQVSMKKKRALESLSGSPIVMLRENMAPCLIGLVVSHNRVSATMDKRLKLDTIVAISAKEISRFLN